MNDTKFIRFAVSILPTAAGMWLAVICLLASFGKPVPWFLWVLFGLEFVVAIAKGISLKMGN